MLGAFAVGPTSGTDYLPLDPVQAMRTGAAHPVPLIIGNNARRGQAVHPVAQAAADERSDDRNPARPTSNPNSGTALPRPTRAIRTRRRAFVSAATSLSGRRRGRSPRPTASTRRPTGTATTMRRARCTGRGWAPPTLLSSSPSSTCTARGSARCSPRRPTGGQRGGSATTCRRAGASSAVPACPATTGPPTPTPTAR